MKVAVMKTKKTVAEALLDDFFKGDENYAGDVEVDEEERSEHDKHWNGNMLVILQELVNIGYCHNFQKEHPYLVDWIYDVCGVIKKANELLGGEPNVKV